MTSLPYCGIYAGWGWENYSVNIGEYLDIGYNFIEGANMRLHDGGPIYVTGYHGGSLALGPQIHDNVSNFYQGTAGIYFDNLVRYATVRNNVNDGTCGYWFYAQDRHDLDGKPIEHGIFPTYAPENAVSNRLYGNTRGPADHAYYWTGSDAPSNFELNAASTNTFRSEDYAPNIIDPQIGDVDDKGTVDRTKWVWLSANTAAAMKKSGAPPKQKIVQEFSQAKPDFDGSTLNLSVFQTLLMGNLTDMGQ